MNRLCQFKLSIVKNFELQWQLAIFPIKHHKLKSGAEGEEEIGDSQEPLRIIPNFVLAIV